MTTEERILELVRERDQAAQEAVDLKASIRKAQAKALRWAACRMDEREERNRRPNTGSDRFRNACACESLHAAQELRRHATAIERGEVEI